MRHPRQARHNQCVLTLLPSRCAHAFRIAYPTSCRLSVPKDLQLARRIRGPVFGVSAW